MIFIIFYLFLHRFSEQEISNRKYSNFDEIMSILDIILLLCCTPVLIRGFEKGFVSQIISIVTLLAGVWTAYLLADIPTDWFISVFEGNTDNPGQIASLASFAIALVASLTIFAIIGWLVEKVIKLVIPDFLNRLLGLMFSAVSTTMLLAVLLLLFESLNNIYYFIDPENAIISDSFLYPGIKAISEIIFPFNNGMLI